VGVNRIVKIRRPHECFGYPPRGRCLVGQRSRSVHRPYYPTRHRTSSCDNVVNAIAPGGVETEGTHAAGVIGSDFEKDMVARTALGRLGQPDDIARIAVFLASDAAAWVTGERLTASGGYR
jgi:Enoyl-(Acyl carrier protein) reductase